MGKTLSVRQCARPEDVRVLGAVLLSEPAASVIWGTSQQGACLVCGAATKPGYITCGPECTAIKRLLRGSAISLARLWRWYIGNRPKDLVCYECGEAFRLPRGIDYNVKRCPTCRSAQKPVRFCENCGNQLRGKQKQTCSYDCKQAVARSRRLARKRHNRGEGSGYCGTDKQEIVAALKETQAGRCACCGDACERLVLDHCHTTGAARSLLCQACNAALGFVREDTARVAKIERYIRERCEPLKAAG